MTRINNQAQRDAAAARGRKRAEETKCPKCGRKNALLPFSHGSYRGIKTVGDRCRWCGFERKVVTDWSQRPPVRLERVGFDETKPV